MTVLPAIADEDLVAHLKAEHFLATGGSTLRGLRHGHDTAHDGLGTPDHTHDGVAPYTITLPQLPISPTQEGS
jgi:hypothetical protein